MVGLRPSPFCFDLTETDNASEIQTENRLNLSKY